MAPTIFSRVNNISFDNNSFNSITKYETKNVMFKECKKSD